MKKYLHAFVMCQSMFCSLPCPWQIWDEKARNKMLLFLPFVGLEIGVLWALAAYLTQILSLPCLITALMLSIFCPLLTGFIHVDGFMDVTDAVGSYRPLERRREILKDSHVGSFAVIGVALLMLAGFSFFASAEIRWPILILIPAVSRCCSSLAVTALRPMSSSQYAAQQKNNGHLFFFSLLLLLLLTAGFLFCGKDGFVLLGCLAGYAAALAKGFRSLDGMNGDISGYAICLGEVCAAAVYAMI